MRPCTLCRFPWQNVLHGVACWQAMQLFVQEELMLLDKELHNPLCSGFELAAFRWPPEECNSN